MRSCARTIGIKRDANYGNHKSERQTPVVESNPRDAALGASQGKGANTAQFLVRVTSVRKILLDEDNLCEKYHVDCCRYAGLIPGDSPEKTRITVAQRKVERGEIEHVIVEVFNLEDDDI